jgi:hypothetical protein
MSNSGARRMQLMAQPQSTEMSASAAAAKTTAAATGERVAEAATRTSPAPGRSARIALAMVLPKEAMDSAGAGIALPNAITAPITAIAVVAAETQVLVDGTSLTAAITTGYERGHIFDRRGRAGFR